MNDIGTSAPPTQAALLNGILDNIHQGFALFDRALRLVAWNGRYLRMLDYPSHLGQTGTPLEDFVRHSALRGDYGPGEPDALVAGHLEQARSGAPYRYERHTPDGRILDVSGGPMPDGGFVVTYTDITELKSAERRQSELSRRLRIILDSAGQGIFGLDVAGKVTFVNREAEELTGYGRHELIGRAQHGLMHHTRRDGAPWGEAASPILRSLADGQERRADDDVFWRKDGTWFPVEYVVSPFGDAGVEGAVVVFSDVTQRRRAQDELRLAKEQADAAQKRLVDAIESISEGFALWDSDDRLVLCNRKYRDMHAPVAHHLGPGISFERFLHLCVDAGLYAEALGDESWLERRLRFHRELSEPFEEHLNDGRWLRVSERRTSDGGHVGIRTDITEIKAREAQLEASEARYREIFAGSTAVQILIDPWDGSIVDANEAAVQFYGHPAERLKHMQVGDINVLSDHEMASEIELARQQQRTHFFFRHRLASGAVRDVEVHSAPVTVEGRPLLHSIVHDVTERRLAEESMRKLRRAIEQSPSSVVITDTDGIIEYVNPKFCAVTGWSMEEVIGRKPSFLRSGETSIEAYQELWKTIASGHEWRGEFLNRRKDGTEVWQSASISPVRDAEGRVTHYVGIEEDITERKRMEEQLHLLATTDALTGMLNRRSFVEAFNREALRGRRYGKQPSLLMLDIDHFKKVNDTWGHAVGDDALRMVAEVCRQALRDVDVLGRFGGEEFTLLLPETEKDAAILAADRLRERIAATAVADGKGGTFTIQVSIGVARHAEGETVETVLNRADEALYEAKRTGRNRVVFH